MVCLQSLHSVGVVTISIPCSYTMPFLVISLFNSPFWVFFFGLLPVLLYVIWFCLIYLTYDITWFDFLLFLFLILHGVCIMGIMGYYLVGVYSSVYVPPPMFVSPVVLIVYIPMFFFIFPFILCFVSYFLVHISPRFCFFPFVWFLTTIG